MVGRYWAARCGPTSAANTKVKRTWHTINGTTNGILLMVLVMVMVWYLFSVQKSIDINVTMPSTIKY